MHIIFNTESPFNLYTSVKRHMQTLYYRCTGMLVHCIVK